MASWLFSSRSIVFDGGSNVVDVGGKFVDVLFANDDICVVHITSPDRRRVGSSCKGMGLKPLHVDVGSQHLHECWPFIC